MSANPIYPNEYNQPSQNIFDRMGHPGKWYSLIPVTGSGEFNFTGSNYGISGLIIDTAGQIITLSGGGNISGSALTLKVIHELSIQKIVSTGGVAYALYRNNKVI